MSNQENYLDANKEYWSKGYSAYNVDHIIFRFYGRILKPDFPHFKGKKLVDFGCGQGAAVNFFANHGFLAKGVDISENDINVARIRYPHIAENFELCDSKPANNKFYGYENDISIVTAAQSLYYLSDDDFNTCLDIIYKSMNKGGVFYATMMGEKSQEYFKDSKEYKNGLRSVHFKNDRLDIKNYYMFFIKDEEDLKQRFKMFKPLHIGYYGAKFRNDEGDGFHYTFCGIKE